MYSRKNHLQTLVIEPDKWERLSDPAYLTHYWEPNQEPEQFHRTFALALCQGHYSDCKDKSRRDKYVVSVAVIRKLECFQGITFSVAADEFYDSSENNNNNNNNNNVYSD